MMELDCYAKVKYYSYRSAIVYGKFFEMDRRTEEAKEFEKKLAEKAGARIDNHTVYEIINHEGTSVYVLCSDFKMSFGSIIEKRHW